MNPLNDVIPAPARKYVYALVFLAGLLATAYQASEGNWVAFVTYLVPTLSSALAASNTSAPAKTDEPDGHAEPEGDEEIYADELGEDAAQA